IYEFPREVKRIRDSLLQFLVESFRPNPLQPSPLLRGFYFSGMRHVPAAAVAASFTGSEYSPKPKTFDATVLFQAKTSPSEATASTLRPDSAETLVERWAFLADLFQKIVLRDPLSQVAAVRNVRRDHRARFLFAGVAVAALLLTGCFTISWLGNLRLLSNVQRGAQIDLSQVPKDGLPALQDLRSLDALRQALTPLAEYRQKGAPWRLRWGLYTGDRVFPRAYEAYFQLFQLYFLTRTENAFSGDLQSLGSLKGSHSYDGIYDTLKAYRMTTSGECKPDAAFLAPVFFHSWQGEQLLDADPIKLAKQQVQFYAAELTRKNPYQLAENPQLIQNGRQALAGFGGVDRLLRGLLEAANQLPRRTVRVADLSPNFRDVLTGPGEVQAAFTSDAWSYVEQKLRQSGQFSLGEACVVGTGASAAGYSGGPEVMAQLNTLYVREYIQVWRKFLASTAVQPFRSPADAARSLGLLADNRSPLLAVLFLTAENTNLVPTPSSNAALSTLPVSAKHPHSREAASAEPGAEFARIFQPVRQAVQVGDRDRLIGDLNRGYVNALGEMQQAMERLAHDSSSNPDFSLHQQAQAAFEKGLDSVRLIAQRFNINGSEGVDTEVKRLLESPFRDCSKFIITDPSKVGRDKILAAAKDFCRRLSAIAHTFPFDPTSDTDATSEQVSAVFAPPAGALFSLEQQLGKTMERQGSYWVQNPDASDLKLSPGFLAFLNHMQAISEGLFSGGSSQLNMQYSLTPLPSLEGESISVAIDGQKLNSAGGESTPTLFSWPGKADQQGVLIRVKAGANIPFASYEGLWSIFRLLDDADPRLPGSRIVEISKVRRGHGRPESVLDENDKPIKVRLQLPDLNGKPDVFEKNFFDIHCPAKVLE
ncbi:MAG TPA: ImcF-related family protein, partial [Bryobacteraceae bacterium]|nr:ImcF-related family protein [Bryobacteraceae bacterium]